MIHVLHNPGRISECLICYGAQVQLVSDKLCSSMNPCFIFNFKFSRCFLHCVSLHGFTRSFDLLVQYGLLGSSRFVVLTCTSAGTDTEYCTPLLAYQLSWEIRLRNLEYPCLSAHFWKVPDQLTGSCVGKWNCIDKENSLLKRQSRWTFCEKYCQFAKQFPGRGLTLPDCPTVPLWGKLSCIQHWPSLGRRLSHFQRK